MGIFERIMGSIAPKPIVIPRIEPGMNTDGEGYFRKEIRAAGVGEHRAFLRRDRGPFGPETSVLLKGTKVAQLLEKYDRQLGPEIERLKKEGRSLAVTVSIDSSLEIKVLMPFPERLIPWLRADPADRSSLSLDSPNPIRLKESGKFVEALLSALDGNSEWKGEITLEKSTEVSGKYKGQTKVLASLNGEQIGTIGARYRDRDLSAFELVEEQSPISVKGAIYISHFDGEPYGTVYPE